MALSDGGFAHLFLVLSWNLMCRSKSNRDSPDRFGKSLAALVCGGSSKAKKDIGTHSIWKGAATFVSSGSTGGPSIISVCLRCGWSLGNVMERYFRYEAAGDQFTGRCVAGLPLNCADFAVLPPHLSGGNDLVVGQAVQIMFLSVCSEIHLVPILQLILASLVYHRIVLIGSLPPHHALLSTSLFTNPDLFANLTTIVISGSTSSCLRASGIPPYVEIYRKLGKNEVILISMPAKILDGVRSIVEDHGVVAGNITRSVLESSIASALSSIQQSNSAMSPAQQLPIDSQPLVYEPFHWGRNMALNPSEQEVSTSFDTARGLFDQLCGETSAKRVRRDGQLNITTLVRLLRQLEPSKTPRVFKKRKRSEQRAGSHGSLAALFQLVRQVHQRHRQVILNHMRRHYVLVGNEFLDHGGNMPSRFKRLSRIS
ncbi:hypothetical protein H257_04583 [Aphanomyces astaci]|uniref:AMP-dependent synthetase/ligase domain-containing protein n=1 Tax=Aphanomyces astaci TaxID=112090 RepID=W4GUU6_APHAT|nr:hypothetical protein H257_04583 [Aphanomyces astaci]ETV82799.1 hypothetical protein H257_04583 [Aphanomyces astaci]|eukprot:XP_009827470.1 hypothetical protein H257_04583 [Aphanomyces astaci]